MLASTYQRLSCQNIFHLPVRTISFPPVIWQNMLTYYILEPLHMRDLRSFPCVRSGATLSQIARPMDVQDLFKRHDLTLHLVLYNVMFHLEFRVWRIR